MVQEDVEQTLNPLSVAVSMLLFMSSRARPCPRASCDTEMMRHSRMRSTWNVLNRSRSRDTVYKIVKIWNLIQYNHKGAAISFNF